MLLAFVQKINARLRQLQINFWFLRGPPPSSIFHDSIYEDYAVICVDFCGVNDCCVVLKSETEFYAFEDHPNTFHHPLRLLPRCHREAGELSDKCESDCGYKGHNIAYTM